MVTSNETSEEPMPDIEPSPAQLGDTMTLEPGEWTSLDDIGTQIYVYGDQPVDIRKVAEAVSQPIADHPYADPGDGRTECDPCGKFVWPVTHSCKGVPVTAAARARHAMDLTPIQPGDGGTGRVVR